MDDCFARLCTKTENTANLQLQLLAKVKIRVFMRSSVNENRSSTSDHAYFLIFIGPIVIVNGNQLRSNFVSYAHKCLVDCVGEHSRWGQPGRQLTLKRHCVLSFSLYLIKTIFVVNFDIAHLN